MLAIFKVSGAFWSFLGFGIILVNFLAIFRFRGYFGHI